MPNTNGAAEVAPIVEDVLEACDNCGQEVESLVRMDYDGNYLCESCVEEYFFCQSCDQQYPNSQYGSDGHCEGCEADRNDDRDEVAYRSYSTANLPLFQSAEAGDVITSPRFFSAEIECNFGTDVREMCRELPLAVGIASDGSLGRRGIELQTPKLQGRQGEKMLRKICTTLRKYACGIDENCGLHIHLDGADFIPATLTREVPEKLKNLMLFYLAFDGVIESFLPQSRRNGYYCKRMSHAYNAYGVKDCKTLRDVEKLWYMTDNVRIIDQNKRHKHSSRYHGINFHSLLADKHLEIRYHSGTIRAHKMLNWVALHQAIMDYCAAGGTTPLIPSDATLQSLTALLMDTLQLPQDIRAYFLKRQADFAERAGMREGGTCEADTTEELARSWEAIATSDNSGQN